MMKVDCPRSGWDGVGLTRLESLPPDSLPNAPPLYPSPPQSMPPSSPTPQLPPHLGMPMNFEGFAEKPWKFLRPDNLTIASSSLILQFYKVFKKHSTEEEKNISFAPLCACPENVGNQIFIEAAILIGRHHFIYVFVEKIPHVLAFRWNFRGIECIHKKTIDIDFPVKAKYPTLVYNMSLLRTQYQLLGR